MTDLELVNARKFYREEMERQKEFLELLKCEQIVKLRINSIITINNDQLLDENAVLCKAFNKIRFVNKDHDDVIMVYISDIYYHECEGIFKYTVEEDWNHKKFKKLCNLKKYKLYKNLGDKKLELVSVFDYNRFKENYLIINLPDYTPKSDLKVKFDSRELLVESFNYNFKSKFEKLQYYFYRQLIEYPQEEVIRKLVKEETLRQVCSSK